MEITVTGRHLDITPAIREYATSKVSKLPKYYNRVQAIDLVVQKTDHDTHHIYEVEIKVHADRTDPFIAKTQGRDLYACIDGGVDKLERQLTDHKNKVRDRKGNTSMSGSNPTTPPGLTPPNEIG